jgi:hypothetical protein
VFVETKELGKLIIKLSKTREETNDMNLFSSINSLSRQINQAMINYDAEFKILIANQKLQIAAKTSDIFRDIFSRIDLSLSRRSADFQVGIDRFKAVCIEMTNIMIDMNEIVNNINKKVKRVNEKENNKLLTEVKSTQMETLDVIKNQNFNTNWELQKNRKEIEKIPTTFQISVAIK